MVDTQIGIQVAPTSNTPNNTGQVPIISTISPEQAKLYDRLTDADMMYLNKLWRLCYCAELVKTPGQANSNSPIAGYTLIDITIQGKLVEKNMSYEGTMTLTNSILMYVSEGISTAFLDKKFNLEEFTRMSAMSVMGMLISSRRQWKFKNEHMIIPIGLALYENILAIGTRGVEGNLANKVFHPNMFNVPPSASAESLKPKVKWLPL